MRRRKRTVDKVLETAYREGFLSSVYGAPRSCLEYASGWAQYNDVHGMAYDAGRKDAEEVLAHRDDLAGDGRRKLVLAPKDIEVPGEVYAKAYGMSKLALRIGG